MPPSGNAYSRMKCQAPFYMYKNTSLCLGKERHRRHFSASNENSFPLLDPWEMIIEGIVSLDY